MKMFYWRKKLIYVFMIVSSIMILSCGNSSVKHADGSFPYAEFRDIPGITAFEINAIEALQRNTSSFVYGMIMTNETFYNEEGEIKGFSALFCNWLSEFFGIPFKPAIFTWSDLLSGLAAGTIDFSGELTATEERRYSYYMTDAIAERSVKYMRLSGSLPLDVIPLYRSLRYAFLEGSTTADDISDHFKNQNIEVFLVSSANMAYNMLKSGEIDAFFGEGVEASFDRYPEIVTHDIFPAFFSPVSLSTQKTELVPIISVMQKALENGVIRYLTDLYNIGEHEYMRHKYFMRLNEEERLFIQNNSVIAVAAEYDNYPISFYNTHSKEWQGIAIDVLKEVEFFTGISFKVVNEHDTEWPVLLKMLEDGNASIISELIRTEEREGRFLWPQNDVFIDFPALLSRTDFRDIKLNEVLFLKVGLVEEIGQSSMFRRWFPNHLNTVSVENTHAAFRALERGDIDLYMSSRSRLLMYTHLYEQAGYKANFTFDYPFESTFGFNINQDILCSVVDKALSLTDTAGIKDYWFNKTFDYRRKVADARMPLFISLLVLSLLILVLLFILFQKNRTESKKFEKLFSERTAELHNSRQELESALKTAKAANNSKTIFLANMSHEIRTPMNSIVGFSELALDSESSPKTRDYLNKILTNATWLLQIVNDILDISKIESGKMELEIIPFDMHELFSNCRALVMPKAVEKGIMLHFYAEPSIGRKPLGDPTRLRQVFVNLLTNAIKFANAGMVKLLSDIVTADENSITMHFEIKDSGIGMTGEQIEKIFEPFTQAETGTTRKYGGTGLGLAITRSIVEKMGGTLSVESSPGVGSKFSFDLTFSTINITDDEKFRKIQILKEIDKPTFEGEVLLCEDNEMNQLVICEHLSRIGLKTAVAENGRSGVNMIKDRIIKEEKQFDLVFMDIHMPIMDGLDAAQIIQNMNPDIPIVAMTANIMSDDVDVYKKSGMKDCLSKPFTSQELWRCLLNYFTPVSSETVNTEEEKQSNIERDFLISLKQLFIKNNSSKYEEIIKALDNGDIKSAHRFAHTLKSNSAQLRLGNLQYAASDVENHLKDGKNFVNPQQLALLGTELSAALAVLMQQIADYNPAENAGDNQEKLDTKSAGELLDKLESLLRLGNTESLQLTVSLHRINANESLINQLIQQIEDFEFESAMSTLAKIKQTLGIKK